jgi:Bifunctional DNA primase/polymerase, N-terminal
MKRSLQDYVSRNLSDIPVSTASKKPVVNWKEYTERRLSLEELVKLFDQTGVQNVGIVTGAISGIFVLDVDGAEGLDSLTAFGPLPKTPTVKTGKGSHYYFKYPNFTVSSPDYS